MSRRVKIGLGLAISTLALVLTLRHIHVDDVRQAVASAHPLWLLPALGCFFLLFGARTYRWSVLLGGAPFSQTFQALTIGYMMNSTLPLRAGEIGRVLVISQRTRLGVPRALSSVIIERVLDLASVLLLFGVFTKLVPMPVEFSRAASVAALLVVVGVAGGALVVWNADAAERLLRPRLERFGIDRGGVWERFHELCDGIRMVRTSGRLGVVLASTAIIWLMTVLVAYVAMAAFMPPDGVAAGLVVVSSNLGGALPSAPGGFGVVQGFAKLALVVPFHVPDGRAIAYVFIWSLGQQLLLVLLGVVALARFGALPSRARSTAREDVTP